MAGNQNVGKSGCKDKLFQVTTRPSAVSHATYSKRNAQQIKNWRKEQEEGLSPFFQALERPE